jgi:hypothetical protein
MSKFPIDPNHLTALQSLANRLDEQKQPTFIACFDALYTDRDGTQYPAHIQYEDKDNEEWTGFRVWLDQSHRPELFRVYEPDQRIDLFYAIKHSPDGVQHQSEVKRSEAEHLTRKRTPFKCVLYTPHINPFAAGSIGNAEPYSASIKIPVVDLLIDFGYHKGPARINHVGNVRHACYAGVALGSSKIPCYEEFSFRNQ